MKRLGDFMEKLGDNNHVVKCVFIFLSTGMAATLGGIFSGWLALAFSGLVALVMFANYGRLWAFSGPSLIPAQNAEIVSESLQTAPLK